MSEWAGRSRGTAWGWRFVVGALKRVGRRRTYPLVRVIVAWYVLFARAPRRRLARYLAGVGGATTVGALFGRFGEVIIDRMAFLLEGPSAFRYEREGVEHLLAAFGGQEGAILLSAHIGNIEVSAGPHSSRARFDRLKTVRFEADGDHGRGVLDVLPHDWLPDSIVVNRAEGFAALSIVRELRAGAIVAMHADRPVDDRVVVSELLGDRWTFASGPWLVAALAQVPVIVVGCFKEGADTYRLIACPPIRVRFDRKRSREEQIAEWSQAYARQIEAWVRRYPDQWFNFYEGWAGDGRGGG